MTRRALAPVVLACFSVACASAARKPRGPEVILDRYLAPVSSAVFAKVPSCQSSGHCPEQAVKAPEPVASATPAVPVAPEAAPADGAPAEPPLPSVAEPPLPSVAAEPPLPSVAAEPPLPSVAEAPPPAPAPGPRRADSEVEPPLAPELEAARGL